MTIFLAASTRIAPAVLRVQQGLLTIKRSAGTAHKTLKLINELENTVLTSESVGLPSFTYEGFDGSVVMSDVSFSYPNTSQFTLNNINLRIDSGSSVAIVGPSGAGKTTLIDLLLGILEPESGILKISGLKPSETIKKWPGGISYVPQNVEVIAGSVKENVALGYPTDELADELVWRSLEAAQLKDIFYSEKDKLQTQVGENGSKISGGQRQRLGIARALLTNPKLLVLDEATSALDGQTESDISNAISMLSGRTTVIIVAHRLSTVRNADMVIYMDKGEILAKGTFNEVRDQIPNFDIQATLMGL
jgi:ABC-type multidrug transport system fused ATPase/permease subunit